MMPLPKPKENETRKDFITRCMSDNAVTSEYSNLNQRLAVCSSIVRVNKQDPDELRNTGIMVALSIPTNVANTLSMQGEGSIPASDMHLTLAFLGNVDQFEVTDKEFYVKRLKKAVEETAAETTAITGVIQCVKKFITEPEHELDEDVKDVIYAGFDTPEVRQLKDLLDNNLKMRGLYPSAKYDFVPHITLKYVSKDDETNIEDLNNSVVAERLEIVANTIDISIGGEKINVPLKTLEKSQPSIGDVHVESAGGKKDKKKDKKQDKIKVEYTSTILKAHDGVAHKRLVTGVVMEPDTFDAHDDTVSAEVIEKAAYNFMERYRIMGLQHTKKANNVIPVESYIAPVDMVINGAAIKKGSWIMTSRVHDDQLWEKILNGEYTGYSIGGYAEKHDV